MVWRKGLPFALSGFLAGWVVALSAQTIEWPVRATDHEDCELTDICFSDARNGWVTGARGLLLTTSDGGTTWHPQPLGVHCDLETVCFASPTTGWIGGGYRLPRASSSRGVLFSTRDGGKTWTPVIGLDIPRIHKIVCQGSGELYAVGDEGFGRPGGIFMSEDGGLSWSAAPESTRVSWQAGDLHSSGQLVVANRKGVIGRVDGLICKPATGPPLSSSVINDVCLVSETFGVAVGDDGLVAQSVDGGRTWEQTRFELAGAYAGTNAGMVSSIDFQVVCLQRDRLWIAGDPGGFAWRLNAGSQAWVPSQLPTKSAVTAMHFAADQLGWAIARSGDIFHTADGGQSWTVQRRGSRGVAILQVASRPEHFVPEMFARYCADQGYVGGALLVAGKSESTVSLDDCRQAMGRVGGSFTIAVPEGLARSDDDRNDMALREYLVRQIRVLQPRVILVPLVPPRPGERNLQDVVISAIHDAADPSRFKNQIDELDLSTWQVSRMLLMARSAGGESSISPNEFLPELSALAGDYSRASRILLGQSAASEPISLIPIGINGAGASYGGPLMESIESVDGRTPRRDERRGAAGSLVLTRTLAAKEKRLGELMDLAANPLTTPIEFNNALGGLCAELDEPAAGVWLYELGQSCSRKGRTAPARLVFDLLNRQYPRHPLCLSALLHQFDDFSSEEMGVLALRQIEKATQMALARSANAAQVKPLTRPVTQNAGGVAITVWEPVANDENQADENVRPANHLEERAGPLFPVRYRQAESIHQSLLVLDSGALETPERNLAKIRLYGKLAPHVSLEDPLKKIASIPSPEYLVSSAALRELFVQRQGPVAAAKRFGFVCDVADDRPWLDGRLNDPVWGIAVNQRSLMTLTDERGNEAGEILLSCDGKFLFAAITCRRLPDVSYVEPVAVRIPDANLAGADFVTLRFDTDRDYLTTWQFSIDSSGRVADRCGGVIDWNPRWYVATSLDEDQWTAELAIPLAELRGPDTGSLWSVLATRQARGGQFATWWQSDLSGGAIPHPSQRQVATAGVLSPDAFHPDAAAMVLMPWHVAAPTSDEKKKDPPLPASNSGKIENLPPDG